MARSTQQVVEDHITALNSGDIDRIMADYADDAVALTLDGGSVGKQAIRAVFAGLLQNMPNIEFTTGAVAVEGDMLLLQWSAESDTASMPEGVDTFIVRDDKIQQQTGWFKVVPKG